MYDQLYLDSQRRTVDLAERLSAAELDRPVPACPLWSVRDLLAHLAGASVAFTGGPGTGEPGSPEWTQAQVEERRGRPLAELVAEWRRAGPAVAQIPLSSRSWLPILHDALSHEADLRGAIGAPALPADALAAAWSLLTVPIERRLAPLGTVRLALDERPILIGAGTPDVEVEAGQYEFWRAWFGRRSKDQIRGWVRAGDADRFADAVPVFPARDSDLIETG
ncbi:MAG TPA: maleylpyruvate isomerase family mycothiol-dependent enzyme [Jatrophihabitans sp.]|nr:maleylpyruvate isomerase family mycothiol-dependent enzyme [Jatrophihabitans sp.]